MVNKVFMSFSLCVRINVLLHAFFLMILGCRCDEPEVMALVNGEPVTSSELRHWMLLRKAEVHNYFYRNYEITDCTDFWNETHGSESPGEMLKKLALDDAVRCKVQQLLAFENGIIPNIRYDDLMKDMNKINPERKKSVENGETVYGQVQFTSRTYFAYVFDRMVYDLKTMLSVTDLKLKGPEIKIIQEEYTHSFEGNYGFFQMQYVDKKYDNFIDELMSSAEVIINNRVYNKLIIE